ncbi:MULTISPECIES: hypothetical protein [Haloferax]|uniref:DUF2971 domain-containing protein n=1 Tax=Haloferax massiliensis TaxID=1476858 RepID=A0A0D6JT97_9EURY|nr:MULTISPECIES: hypothetical protein [Haloferax]MDS0241884.1 hypothetical protein [Haloferax sp. S2CR25]MDS0445005.1 hypothetical protein [Haloferax sp. S2CR25-2]CQR51235.1 hypothetical protein BN996_02639 [Haloferax massiliensis]
MREYELEIEDVLEDTIEVNQTEETFPNSWRPSKPSTNATLWRYVDFTRFFSMLVQKQIWLPQITQFDDPFEGVWSNKRLTAFEEEIPSPEGQDYEPPKGQTNFSKTSYASCWHKNENQSAALWELYGISNQSVAIKTDFGSLISAVDLSGYMDYSFGCVEYLDYSNDDMPKGPYSPVFHKRKSFQHEQEFRLAVLEPKLIPRVRQKIEQNKHILELADGVDMFQLAIENMPPGINLDINVDQLINEVYIHPETDGWVVKTIQELITTCGYSFTLQKSDLYTNPEELR